MDLLPQYAADAPLNLSEACAVLGITEPALMLTIAESGGLWVQRAADGSLLTSRRGLFEWHARGWYTVERANQAAWAHRRGQETAAADRQAEWERRQAAARAEKDERAAARARTPEGRARALLRAAYQTMLRVGLSADQRAYVLEVLEPELAGSCGGGEEERGARALAALEDPQVAADFLLSVAALGPPYGAWDHFAQPYRRS